MKQGLKLKQKTSRRTIVVIASSSIMLIAIAMIFVFNVGNVGKMFASSTKTIVTTVKDGNWNTGSTWSTGSVPPSYTSDSIVILNNVNLNVDYTVGDGSTNTGITIGAGGSLTGSGHTLFLQTDASVANNGTLSVKALTVNGGGNQIINSGTMSLSTGLSLYNSTSLFRNSGTMSIGGTTTISGSLVNSGTLTIAGDFSTSTNTVITNSGSIAITGSMQFNGGSENNTTYSSSLSIGGNLTVNNGAPIVNSGHISVGTPSKLGTLTVNNGSITNGSYYVYNAGPIFTLYGSMTLSGGGNYLLNNGFFTVSQSILSYAGSTITDNDSITVGTTFASQSNITVNRKAYLGVGTDFANSASLDIEDGYVMVSRNFTNNILTGSGGGISIANNYVNNGSVTGTIDVCDKTPNTPNDINGTMASTVTTCSFVPPTTGPSGASPLPVTLTKFTATKDGKTVELNWTTASEINNDRFEIERSDNGTDFSVIGTVNGNGTKQTFTNYSYIDESPLPGIAYYRLHQFDFNGKSAYSPIAAVHFDGDAQQALDVSVNPNPVHAGNALHLEMTIPVSDMLDIELVDIRGESVYHNNMRAEAGKIQHDINVPSNLSGMYILKITYRGQTTSEKILVK